MTKACGNRKRWFAARGIAVLICAVFSLCLPMAAFADDGLRESGSFESEVTAAVLNPGDNTAPVDASDDFAAGSVNANEQGDSRDAGDSPANSEGELAAYESGSETDGSDSLDDFDSLLAPGSSEDAVQSDDAAQREGAISLDGVSEPVDYNELIEPVSGDEPVDSIDPSSVDDPAHYSYSYTSAADIVDGRFKGKQPAAALPKKFDFTADVRDDAGSQSNEMASAPNTAPSMSDVSSLGGSGSRIAAYGSALSRDEATSAKDEDGAPASDIDQDEVEKAGSFAKADRKRETLKADQLDPEGESEAQLTTSLQKAAPSADVVAVLPGCEGMEYAEEAGCGFQADSAEGSQPAEECAPVMATPAHHGRVGFAFPGTSDGLPCAPPELEASVRLAKAFTQGEYSLLVPDEGSTVCSLRASLFQGRDDEGKPTCRRGCMRCRSPSHSLV